jgi:hypothetical protein
MNVAEPGKIEGTLDEFWDLAFLGKGAAGAHDPRDRRE